MWMEQRDQSSRAVWKLSGTIMLVVTIVFLPVGAVVTPRLWWFNLLWNIFSLLFLMAAIWMLTKARQRRGSSRRSAARTTAKAEQREEHDHIPSMALDTKERLEQLETLRKAGLLTWEEYQAKRKEIGRGPQTGGR